MKNTKVIIVDPSTFDGVDAESIVDNMIIVHTTEAGEEYGTFVLESSAISINESGFVNDSVRRLFVKNLLPKTQAVVKELKLRIGANLSKTSFGACVLCIQERVEHPFSPNQEPKRAGKDGDYLLADGLPIYRRTVLMSEESAIDTIVAHTDRVDPEDFLVEVGEVVEQEDELTSEPTAVVTKKAKASK